MEVVQKSGEGLTRVYGVTVPADELGALLEARILEIAPQLNLRGFRPGKVPAAHVRRIYGKALMGEVVEKALNETSQKVLEENNLRIASQPDLQPSSDMDNVIAGKEDLAYELNVEIMPEFEPLDTNTLKLTRPVYTPTKAEIDAELADLAKQSRTYEDRKGKSVKAQDGDQLTIDFVGRVGGKIFDGGTAEDTQLVLGSGQFIPGFEEQLVGAKVDDQVKVKVTFPENYSSERLKGKAAEFAVTVKAIKAPVDSKPDDALAERLGMKDLDALREALKSNLESQYTGASRFKVKRALLDKLDSGHDFPLPQRMVEAEFEGIWSQVEGDRDAGNLAPEDEGKTDEELRAEYRKIAERRVRLGLVLAEIGRRASVSVTEQELSEAMRQEAMRYGAQAQQMFDMLRKNANAQAQMRAPLYEEKVVDLILGRAKVTDKAVTKDELMAEDEMPEGYGEEKPAKAAKASKAKAKTPEPVVAAAPEPAAAEPEAEPAKKPAKAKAKAVEPEVKAEEPAPVKAPAKAKAPKAEAKAEAAPAEAAPAKPAKAKAPKAK